MVVLGIIVLLSIPIDIITESLPLYKGKDKEKRNISVITNFSNCGFVAGALILILKQYPALSNIFNTANADISAVIYFLVLANIILFFKKEINSRKHKYSKWILRIICILLVFLVLKYLLVPAGSLMRISF